LDATRKVMTISLSGATAFVTGGSGFIGGRLIESLVRDHNVKVRALVNRPFAGALRMARFPVEFIFEPMTDREKMSNALKGCDFVFHLAYGKTGTSKEQYRVTVEGTRALANAAADCGIHRFVNVSTAAVYGNRKAGIIDENSPRLRWGWDYSDMKLDAENEAMLVHRQRGLPVTTLQVAGVYGPWGPVFTITPLTQLQKGIVGLPNEGQGVSNATYVDDVVQALCKASTKKEAIGETFIIKGPGRVTRREFYEHYQTMLGINNRIRLVKKEEFKSLLRQKQRRAWRNLVPTTIVTLKGSTAFRETLSDSGLVTPVKWLRGFRKKKFSQETAGSSSGTGSSELPLFLPPLFYANYLSAETEYSNKKAIELLGFDPVFEVDSGMAMTEAWARWARIIPAHHMQNS
jgi:nucleoside-diphosphate-sugar epimerase